MGWLSKLPRFIRPPKKVRQAIEKVKPGKALVTIGVGLIPGVGIPAAIALRAKGLATLLVKGGQYAVNRAIQNAKQGIAEGFEMSTFVNNPNKVNVSSLPAPILTATSDNPTPTAQATFDNTKFLFGAIGVIVLLMLLTRNK